LKLFSSHWNGYGWSSFWLILLINVLLLINMDDPDQITMEDSPQYNIEVAGIAVLGIFQLFFALLSFSFYMLEYYPIIIQRAMLAESMKGITSFLGVRNNDSVAMQ
jgi:hypothetical protein